MVTLTRPISDLVTSDLPLTLTLGLQDEAAIHDAVVSISLRRAEPGLSDGEAVTAEKVGLESGSEGGRKTITVQIDGSTLAEGEYTGELVLEAGEASETWPISFFRVPEPKPRGFPFGIYAVPFPEPPESPDAILQEMKDAGINLICQHMSGMGDLGPTMDRAARLGLQFRPSDNLRGGDWPESALYRLANDAERTAKDSPCRNNPEVRKYAVERFAEHLREYGTHPGFSGTVYYGDDLFLTGRCYRGRANISCHCEWCRSDFRAHAGHAPPLSTDRKVGIVDAADPWLEWMRYRCRQNFGGLINEIEAAKNSVDPSIHVGLCHGWPDNPFVSVATGIYAPWTQPTNVVSSYCYPFLRSPAADFVCHYEIAKMGNRDKEVWMLGLCAADGTMAPRWQVYQNYWNMLAAGYKSIAFFSWWDYGKIEESGTEDDMRRMAESKRALARCGEHKDWVLPSARFWEEPDARAAVLYSFTTEAFDIEPHYRGHEHSKRVCELYRLAMRSQVPMKVICEEEVRDGILEQFDAVCLHDVRVLPHDLRPILEQYAASGKTVLVDSDYLYTDAWHPNVKAEIKGALELSHESMVAFISDRSTRPVTLDSPDVTVRQFATGDVEHFVFVNNTADRYWGLTYSYGDRAENYRRAAKISDGPVETEVRFSEKGRWLFDLATGESFGTTDEPLELRLEPSWGRVLAALPSEGASLRVDGPTETRQGEAVRYRPEFCDNVGVRVVGAFTVKVTVTTPSGRQSRYSAFIGIEDGAGEFVLPVGSNDEVGGWTVSFEGGFPRRTVECGLLVAEGEGRPAILSVQEAR